MTRPNKQQAPDVPASVVSELHALYQENAGAEPDLLLDRRILDAARAELQNDSLAKSQRRAPWWKAWLLPVSVAAVAVLGLSVSVRVMDEQERQLRETIEGSERAPAAVAKVLPAERPVVTKPSISAPESNAASPRLESRAAQRGPATMEESRADKAPNARVLPAQPDALRDEAVAAGAVAESVETARTPAPPMAAPAPMATTKELKKRGDAEDQREAALASTPNKAEAKVADDAPTPEAWLKHVRELQASGRSTEAAQSLARLRARYPDFVLPDDLSSMK